MKKCKTKIILENIDVREKLRSYLNSGSEIYRQQQKI